MTLAVEWAVRPLGDEDRVSDTREGFYGLYLSDVQIANFYVGEGTSTLIWPGQLWQAGSQAPRPPSSSAPDISHLLIKLADFLNRSRHTQQHASVTLTTLSRSGSGSYRRPLDEAAYLTDTINTESIRQVDPIGFVRFDVSTNGEPWYALTVEQHPFFTIDSSPRGSEWTLAVFAPQLWTPSVLLALLGTTLADAAPHQNLYPDWHRASYRLNELANAVHVQ